MWFAGMRGAVSFALAITLPAATGHDAEAAWTVPIVTTTLGLILFLNLCWAPFTGSLSLQSLPRTPTPSLAPPSPPPPWPRPHATQPLTLARHGAIARARRPPHPPPRPASRRRATRKLPRGAALRCLLAVLAAHTISAASAADRRSALRRCRRAARRAG